MARPRVTETRRNEILDAFEECVATHGLEGTTLERLAAAAGLRRSLIRHHIGNRDQLLVAWVDRAVGRYSEDLKALLVSLPTTDRSQTLVRSLFGWPRTRPDRVMDRIVATAAEHDEARDRIARFVEEMIDLLADELGTCYPHASRRACLEVAGGLTALSMTSESLTPLEVQASHQDALAAAAERLVTTLRSDDSK